MFDGPDPIYLQIAEYLRDQILRGTLAEEAQVMSTTQFATTFRINPATAAKAFTLLVDDGIIYKQRGVGMFVRNGARMQLREQRRNTFYADRLDAVLTEAGMLGIAANELIDYIEQKGTGA